MSDIVSTIILGLATIPVTIGLVLFIGLVLHWGHNRERSLMPYIFYTTFLVLALDTILSARVLNQQMGLDGMEVLENVTKHPLVTWLGRANSLFILFSACERIATRLLASRPKADIPVLLLVTIWAFFLTNVASPGFLSAHPQFTHEYLYVIIASTGAALLHEQEAKTVMTNARNALFIFIMLSAVLSVFHPDLTFKMNYTEGLIPGLNLRYYGLNSHANAFGPIVVVFLTCLWRYPYLTRGLNFLAWTIGLASLLLTQSKTSWIVMLLGMFCLGYFRYGDFFRQLFFDYKRPQFLAATLVLVMLSSVALANVAMFTDTGDKIVTFFSTSEGGRVLSLSGRDQIWTIALQEWHRSPLFGYGLTLWDEQYRAQIGLAHAVSAHSQFYQSLSVAGIVGAVGLMIYFVTLFCAALKTAKLTGGISMALFLMILLRSLSEPAVIMDSFGPEVMSNLLIIMVMATHYGHQRVQNRAFTTLATGRFA